jgi:hypothetical protein
METKRKFTGEADSTNPKKKKHYDSDDDFVEEDPLLPTTTEDNDDPITDGSNWSRPALPIIDTKVDKIG